MIWYFDSGVYRWCCVSLALYSSGVFFFLLKLNSWILVVILSVSIQS